MPYEPNIFSTILIWCWFIFGTILSIASGGCKLFDSYNSPKGDLEFIGWFEAIGVIFGFIIIWGMMVALPIVIYYFPESWLSKPVF